MDASDLWATLDDRRVALPLSLRLVAGGGFFQPQSEGTMAKWSGGNGFTVTGDAEICTHSQLERVLQSRHANCDGFAGGMPQSPARNVGRVPHLCAGRFSWGDKAFSVVAGLPAEISQRRQGAGRRVHRPPAAIRVRKRQPRRRMSALSAAYESCWSKTTSARSTPWSECWRTAAASRPCNRLMRRLAGLT